MCWILVRGVSRLGRGRGGEGSLGFLKNSQGGRGGYESGKGRVKGRRVNLGG
jgi:hypothetical protein